MNMGNNSKEEWNGFDIKVIEKDAKRLQASLVERLHNYDLVESINFILGWMNVWERDIRGIT